MSGGISSAGCARPDPDRRHRAAPLRSRSRTWSVAVAGIVIMAAVAAGASAYALSGPPRWVLTAPPTAGGLGRDHNRVDQLSFASAVAKFRSSVTSLPTYRQLRSTVSGIYSLGPSQAVGFVGLNGSFSEQVMLSTTSDLTVKDVNPGPHGGLAECGHSRSDTVCDWSTPTTMGILLIAPTSGSRRMESITAADELMIKIRGTVERPAHRS
jgi:hypothetical protein